ncbi:serine hydrolase [Bradyrhizobium sp. SSUT112]|uniref:serine hydrolase domain-containing protein n=1 Tax=Bradyrhizobium sp. SSUT112 TaxID=3040604 RepID=UPI00244A3AAC|nr:serine hydrolase [Bradyrhizobium sp. SSUT112]MDH2357274.1 serine hydrolase [Bradyrhizobium sp. SSUT112]
MDKIDLSLAQGRVQGYCDPRFVDVLDVFAQNFKQRGELGASVCISVEGKTVVDLWGGLRSSSGEPWEEDTLCVVFSCTKGASALCAHMAADRNLLDLDAPVTRYWPEFGQNGKEEARVSMMLDHSVGLPTLHEPTPDGAAYDYAYMCERIAAERPFWKPGARNGYHPFTFSWTVGEMVRRSTQRRLGRFFADEVAGPLGLNFWIGLPEAQEHRVAPVVLAKADTNSRIMRAAMADVEGPAAKLVNSMGGFNANAREARAAEVGGANGVSNARGLARMYEALANGGRIRGVQLIGKDTLSRIGRVSVASHEDALMAFPTRFSLGFMKSFDNRKLENSDCSSVILGEQAFGHVGQGGSIGFADPECRLGFGYVMNRLGAGMLLNDRGQSLVDAAYRALGYRSNVSGAWTF